MLMTKDTLMSIIVPFGNVKLAIATGVEGDPSAEIHDAVSESAGGRAIT